MSPLSATDSTLLPPASPTLAAAHFQHPVRVYWEDTDAGGIVADTQMRFLKPARLDDRLTVTVSVVEVGRASVAFSQDVWRGDTLLTQGRVRIGGVQAREGDDHLRPGRIPARIQAILPVPNPISGG